MLGGQYVALLSSPTRSLLGLSGCNVSRIFTTFSSNFNELKKKSPPMTDK